MIPSREGHNSSAIAYVTYTWVTIYAQREIQLTEDLPEGVPKGFDELRTEILSYHDSVPIVPQEQIKDDGKMGLYVVYTYDIRGLYRPQEFLDRYKVGEGLLSPKTPLSRSVRVPRLILSRV
jgi:hypothetical protein